ncbi:MAG: DUF4185 domain-containing protein [Candidatus Thorarchaeota archaeon]
MSKFLHHKPVTFSVVLSTVIISFSLIFTSIPFLSSTTYLPHSYLSQLTGAAAFTDTTPYGVYGTDLGIIVKHNSKYHFIFGDTFGLGGLNWRSNTMAYSTDTDPSDGISLDGWIPHPPTGLAKELISSLKEDNVEMTCIPTTALSFDGLFYIYYMSVRHWGILGGVWQCNNASIAVSADNGHTFTKMTNISWTGTSNFVQFGFVQDEASILSDGFFYFLATPSGRYGACYLSRVPQDSLLNQSAYQYFTGTGVFGYPQWSSNYASATSIFSAPVGELSVMWNEYLEKWTAFYFDNVANNIVLRTATNLWGPWSSPYAIVGAGEYPSLYGSFVHPDLVENNGQTVYFIMSKFDVYNTFVMSVDLSFLSPTTSSPTSTSALSIITLSSLLFTTFISITISQKKKK